jgi:hypothetical protein
MDKKLTKENSRSEILFMPEKDDEFFYNVIFRSTKTKKVTKSIMITKNDINSFLEGYLNDGWILNDNI